MPPEAPGEASRIGVAVAGPGRAAVLARHVVSRETLARLDIYHRLLQEWQKKMNLVAASTLHEVWERHIEDSLAFLEVGEGLKRWVDLGSGGGFPGIVIAIGLADLPGASVQLVESNAKKAAFLRAVIRETGVPALVHATRIEECGGVLAAADAVSARALAALDVLCGFVSGRLAPGVPCFFAKGRGHAEEILDASRHWRFTIVKHPSRSEAGSALLEVREIAPLAAAIG